MDRRSSPTRAAAGRGGGRVLLGRLVAYGRALGDAVLPVLFPDRCVGCGVFETALCPACAATLVPADRSCCPRCGQPDVRIGASPRCPACFSRELACAAARSAFVYQDAGRDLVAALKFGGRRTLAPLMADLARPSFEALMAGRSRVAVTWVPGHASVERRRGYNQAELLARALAAGNPAGDPSAAALPVVPLVRKVRRTAGQRTLSRAERRRNLEQAFAPAARAASQVAGAEAVILVDDVYTTGATSEAVSQVLAGYLGLPILVFTFARTPGALVEGVA